MLKIGKNKDLIFYKKERLFTPTFWLSLSIVSFLHLFLFISFKVKKIKTIEHERRFSSAYIETTALSESESTHAIFAKENLQTRNPLFLSLTTPTFYSFLPVSRVFSSLESFSFDVTALPRSTTPNLNIETLGFLAERDVYFSKNLKDLCGNIDKPFRFCCEVQVDNSLGEIFDYLIVEKNGINHEEEIIHEILKNIKFNILDGELISVGVIEVSAQF